MIESRQPSWVAPVNKLLALCGLLTFIVSCGLLCRVVESSSDRIIDMVEAFEILKRVPQPSEVQELRRAMLEQKIDLAVSNRQTYTVLLIVVAATAANVSWFGFRRWLGTVQPQADELTRLQVEIARLELRKLQLDCEAAEKLADWR